MITHSSVVSGTTVSGKGLAEVIQDAEARGATGAEVDKIEKQWLEEHPLCTFNEGEKIASCICFPLGTKVPSTTQPFKMRSQVLVLFLLLPRNQPDNIIWKQSMASRTVRLEISQPTFLGREYAGIGIVSLVAGR